MRSLESPMMGIMHNSRQSWHSQQSMTVTWLPTPMHAVPRQAPPWCRGHSRVWRGASLSPMLPDRSPRGPPGSPGLPADFLTQASGMSFTSQPAPQDPAGGPTMALRLSAKMPFVSATAGLSGAYAWLNIQGFVGSTSG